MFTLGVATGVYRRKTGQPLVVKAPEVHVLETDEDGKHELVQVVVEYGFEED